MRSKGIWLPWLAGLIVTVLGAGGAREDGGGAMAAERREAHFTSGGPTGRNDPQPQIAVAPLSGARDDSGQSRWAWELPVVSSAHEFLFLQAIWMALATVLLVHGVRGMGRLGAQTALLAAATVVAFALRAGLATWGPGDLRHPDNQMLRGNDGFNAYGNTVAALVLLLDWLPVARDRLLVASGLVLGSLAILPMWGAAKALTAPSVGSRGEPVGGGAAGDSLTAWLAMSIWGLQPLLIRASGEGSRMGQTAFLAVVVLWGVVRYLSGKARLPLLAAFLGAVLLPGTRPECLLYSGFILGVMLFVPRLPTRQELPWRLLLMVAVVLPWWPQVVRLMAHDQLAQATTSVSGMMMSVLERKEFPFSPSVVVHLDLNFTPLVFMIASAIGAVVGGWQRRFWVLWFVATMVLYALPMSGVPRGLPGEMHLASARYQLLTLVPFSLVAAFGGAWLWRQVGRQAPRGLRPVLIALLVGTSLLFWGPPLRRVTVRTDLDDEYRFLREVIPHLPEGAQLYSVIASMGDWGLVPPDYLPAALGREDISWHSWPEEWSPSSRPQFLATQPACGRKLDFGPWNPVSEISTADAPGVLACRLSSYYAEKHGSEPFREQSIELRSFLAANRRGAPFKLGIYPLDQNRVAELLRSVGLGEFRPAWEGPSTPRAVFSPPGAGR